MVADRWSILIVDDHKIVTDGVRYLLHGDPHFSIAGSAGSGEQAVRMVADSVAEGRPIDLVLLDLRLPDGDPLELVVRLRAASPTLKIVIFTAYPEITVLQSVVAAGVQGCLIKDAVANDLAADLHKVLDGGRVFDPRISSRPDLALHDRLAAIGLTRREYEVLRLVATGRSNPEVAEQMSLARNTVKTYLQSAMQKLGVRNRVEAITKASEIHLL
ncbi:response regulator [Rhodococcus koreensis]